MTLADAGLADPHGRIRQRGECVACRPCGPRGRRPSHEGALFWSDDFEWRDRHQLRAWQHHQPLGEVINRSISEHRSSGVDRLSGAKHRGVRRRVAQPPRQLAAGRSPCQPVPQSHPAAGLDPVAGGRLRDALRPLEGFRQAPDRLVGATLQICRGNAGRPVHALHIQRQPATGHIQQCRYVAGLWVGMRKSSNMPYAFTIGDRAADDGTVRPMEQVTQQSVNACQVSDRPAEQIKILGLVITLNRAIVADKFRKPAAVRSDDGERLGGFGHCGDLAIR